jgi:hypothetical protein
VNGIEIGMRAFSLARFNNFRTREWPHELSPEQDGCVFVSTVKRIEPNGVLLKLWRDKIPMLFLLSCDESCGNLLGPCAKETSHEQP